MCRIHRVLPFPLFVMMDYAPRACKRASKSFLVAAGNTMERLASENGRAAKWKNLYVRCHPAFVLLKQMDGGGEPKK